MARQDIVMGIGADVSAALRAVADLQKQTKKHLSIMERHFDGLKRVAEGALTYLAARQIGQFIGDSIKAASEADTAFLDLTKAMQNAGDYSAVAASQFQKFADGMDATTRFSDDVIVAQLKIAKSFNTTNAEAQELVAAAADLSAATGVSLDAAVKTLGNTLSGVTGKLDEQIPAVKGLTKEQLAHGDAIKIVLERYGGSAKVDVENFGGAVTQLEHAYGNLQEAIGRFISQSPEMLDIVQTTTDIIRDLSAAMDDSRGETHDWAAGLKDEFFGIIDLPLRFAQGYLEMRKVLTDNSLLVRVFSPEEIENSDKMLASVEELRQKLADKSTGVAFAEGVKSVEQAVKDLEESSIGYFRQLDDLAVQEQKKRDDKAKERSAVAAKEAAKAAEKALTEYEYDRASIGANVLRSMKEIPTEFALQIDRALAELPAKAEKAAEDALKKFDDYVKDQLEREREEILAITQDPITWAVKLTGADAGALRESLGLSRLQEEIAGAFAGGLDAALSGASGAKELIATAAGQFADALIPGIGPAIKSIVGKLSEGPEATKAFIKEFILAVPDIMVAVAESIPAVVEAFVDTMVNRGGAAKIAWAMIRVFSGAATLEYIGKGIGKEMGISAGDMFKGPQFRRTISDAFSYGADRFYLWLDDFRTNVSDATARFKKDISGTFKDGVAGLGRAIQNLPNTVARSGTIFQNAAHKAGVDIKAAVTQAFGFVRQDLPRVISGAFKDGANAVLQAIGAAMGEVTGALTEFPEAAGQAIGTGITAVTGAVSTVLGNLQTTITDQINAAAKSLAIPRPAWLDEFIEALHPGFVSNSSGSVDEATTDAVGSNPVIDYIKPRIPKARGGRTVSAGRLTAGGGADDSLSLLREIRDLLMNPTTAEVKWRDEVVGKIVLNLNRRGARLA